MGKIIRNGIEYPSGGGGGGGSWITDIPEMHKNIFRGNNLGSEVTAAQLSAIQNGTFSDLYVGDYWTIPVTVNGTELSVNWRIADIDYYYNRGNGNTPLTTHHLLIVPDICLYKARMHSSNIEVYYPNTEMYTTNLALAKQVVNTAFPNMVLHYYEVYGTAYNAIATYETTVELLYPLMVTGSTLAMEDSVVGTTRTQSYLQLALFSMCPKYIPDATGETYWLRERPNVEGNRGYLSIFSRIGYEYDNTELGVRPYFIIGVDNTEE